MCKTSVIKVHKRGVHQFKSPSLYRSGVSPYQAQLSRLPQTFGLSGRCPGGQRDPRPHAPAHQPHPESQAVAALTFRVKLRLLRPNGHRGDSSLWPCPRACRLQLQPPGLSLQPYGSQPRGGSACAFLPASFWRSRWRL